MTRYFPGFRHPTTGFFMQNPREISAQILSVLEHQCNSSNIENINSSRIKQSHTADPRSLGLHCGRSIELRRKTSVVQVIRCTTMMEPPSSPTPRLAALSISILSTCEQTFFITYSYFDVCVRNKSVGELEFYQLISFHCLFLCCFNEACRFLFSQ